MMATHQNIESLPNNSDAPLLLIDSISPHNQAKLDLPCLKEPHITLPSRQSHVRAENAKVEAAIANGFTLGEHRPGTARKKDPMGTPKNPFEVRRAASAATARQRKTKTQLVAGSTPERAAATDVPADKRSSSFKS